MRGLGGGGPDANHDEATSKIIDDRVIGAMPGIAACVAATPAPIRTLSVHIRPGGPSRCEARPTSPGLEHGLRCCIELLDQIALPPGDYEVFTIFEVIP